MRAVLVSGRSFGDAIMVAFFLKTLEKNNSEILFDIITKEKYCIFYEDLSIVDSVMFLNFPYMQLKSNITKGLIKGTLKDYFTIRKIKRHYDFAVDFLGDVRERTILSMLDIDKIYSIERGEGNEFNQLIRRGLSSKVVNVNVCNDVMNFYEQMNVIYMKLFGSKLYSINHRQINVKTIGIHPFASQPSKLWKYENWNNLISLLINDGYKVIIFCAPSEKESLIYNISSNENVKIVCGDIKVFFSELKKVDLLIGLESFSIHASNYLNIPNISLVGAQNGNLWKSPTTTIIQGKSFCGHWPCYNKPCKCEFDCMNSISVDEVYASIKQKIKKY